MVIAPDSFKSTMSAAAAARAIAEGWAAARPSDSLILRPMADGGEGTLEAFASLPGAERVPVDVVDALGEPRRSHWVRLPDDTAVVELAECCGLTTVSHLAPREAHTLGFGLAIRAALEAGVTRLLLAIGGSASTDGGLGLLVGLGLRVTGEGIEGVEKITMRQGASDVEAPHLKPSDASINSAPSLPALGNAALERVRGVDWADVLAPPRGGAFILSDVTNPLLGAKGAAAVFGPQKGGASIVEEMDQNLAVWAELLAGDPGAPGAGAAGGAGFALQRWGAETTSGARTVAEAIGLPEAMAEADLVITGEGSFDSQTAGGKAIDVVRQLAAEAAAARGRELPVAVVAGRMEAAFDGPAVALWDLAGERALTDAAGVAREAAAELARQLS